MNAQRNHAYTYRCVLPHLSRESPVRILQLCDQREYYPQFFYYMPPAPLSWNANLIIFSLCASAYFPVPFHSTSTTIGADPEKNQWKFGKWLTFSRQKIPQISWRAKVLGAIVILEFWKFIKENGKLYSPKIVGALQSWLLQSTWYLVFYDSHVPCIIRVWFW